MLCSSVSGQIAVLHFTKPVGGLRGKLAADPIAFTSFIYAFYAFLRFITAFASSLGVDFFNQTGTGRGASMFLRRFAGPLLAKVKETTGIVGLDVVPNAREVLISLYRKTLKEIQAVPPDEGYRKAVESFTTNRLKVCQEEEDWEQIEKRIGCGQVEELIEEARDELTLIGKMIEWDPWGVPDDYECEVIENDAPVPKHVPLHKPPPLPAEFYMTLEELKAASNQPPPIAAKKDDEPSTISS